MDTNTDRIINLLVATTSEGELASGLLDQIIETADELAAIGELAAAANDNTTSFVDALIEAVVEDIVRTRGDSRVVGSMLGTAYLTGLMFGLSIATLAAEA